MKKLFIKKILPISIITLFFAQALYVTVVEPTIATAVSVSDTVVVNLNVEAGIAITGGTDPVTMSPNIGVTAMKSVGESSWNVKTNNATGYTLTVQAPVTTPALIKPAVPGLADSFADYTPAAGIPDTWGGVASGDKEFGFSARGPTTDVLASFGPTATTCGDTGTGIVNGTSKYLGFNGATPIQIATRTTPTTPSGITTYICFAAEQGSGTYATSGTYTTTITATASTL